MVVRGRTTDVIRMLIQQRLMKEERLMAMARTIAAWWRIAFTSVIGHHGH